ncbi:MAG: hypothetical protein AVDCRST_MAG42-1033, partial [uncultured Chthoniobacterales bacterium]
EASIFFQGADRAHCAGRAAARQLRDYAGSHRAAARCLQCAVGARQGPRPARRDSRRHVAGRGLYRMGRTEPARPRPASRVIHRDLDLLQHDSWRLLPTAICIRLWRVRLRRLWRLRSLWRLRRLIPASASLRAAAPSRLLRSVLRSVVLSPHIGDQLPGPHRLVSKRPRDRVPVPARATGVL